MSPPKSLPGRAAASLRSPARGTPPPDAGPDSPVLPAATVGAVVAEVIGLTVAECSSPADRIDFVTDAPVDTRCDPPLDCRPLAAFPGAGAGARGHLHRSTTDPVGRSAEPTRLDLVAALIVSRVTQDLLDVRLAQLHHEVQHLEIALTSNRTIGVAIGVLMVTQRCTADDAFEALRSASQNRNRKLRDVAADVVYTGTLTESDIRATG